MMIPAFRIVLSIALFSLLLFVLPLKAQTIWFSPRFGSADYMNLFQSESDWQHAASRVKVFTASGAKVLDPRWSDSLAIMLADLRRRHIALEIGILPLTGEGEGHCGFHVEGYSAAGQQIANAKRLKAAGAEVSYFAMDEPFYNGHVFNGKNACHSSIDELAKDAAVKIKQLRAVYPNAAFGDVEPMGIPDAHWISELEQWFDAYQAATGTPLAFFRVDMQWKADWKGQMQQLTTILQRRGISLQMIYNGDGNAGSDENWTAQAVQRFQLYETSGLPKPDVAVFQCWTPNPTHVLPESDPHTMTGLIDQYIQWKHAQ